MADENHQVAVSSGRYRSRDEEVVSRLRHERDRRPRAARRARRPQARAPAHPVRHARAGPDLRRKPTASAPRSSAKSSANSIRTASAGLRRAGAHGAVLQHALSAGRRAGKLRLGRRRSARGHAVHRSAPGAHQRRAARRHRKRNRRFHSELRRDRARNPSSCRRASRTCWSMAPAASPSAWPRTSRRTT